jgi:hypothetical protein
MRQRAHPAPSCPMTSKAAGAVFLLPDMKPC